MAEFPVQKFMDGEMTWFGVQKDAGDDPDVTHGAWIYGAVGQIPKETESEVWKSVLVKAYEWEPDADADHSGQFRLFLTAKEGIGLVTKPGLSCPVGKYAIVYVTHLLPGWTFDIMDISKNSLVPVMSADSKERNSLSLFAALGTMAGAAVLGVVSPLIVAEATLENYYILIFGSMAMVLVLSLVGVTFVKERVGFEGKKEEKYSLKELVSFLRYKPVWSFFILALVAGTGSTIAGGAGTFFYTYVMGDLTLASGVTVISLVAALIGIFLGPILANRMGKKNVYLLCIVISIIFTALRLIDVRSMTLIYISSLCGGIAGGCLQPLNTSIQADNTTYVQYKTGKRAEAAIASLTSFITKVAQGLGGAIPGYVLAAFGFVEGSVQQPESINTGIILCVLILPMILTGLGAILFGTQYTLDKKAVEEMHASLAEGKQE